MAARREVRYSPSFLRRGVVVMNEIILILLVVSYILTIIFKRF